MASTCTSSPHTLFTLPLNSTKCFKNRDFATNPSQILPSNSILSLKKQTFFSTIQTNKLKNRNFRVVVAYQSNIFKAIQTAWKVGKDAVDAGTSLVPDSVPRPLARVSVAVVAGTITLFVLKSFISTAFFVLAMMGVIYFTFIAFNKDETPRPKEGEGAASVDESLEEARRIMEKYK